MGADGDAADVLAAEHAWVEAALRGDATTLGALAAPSLVYVHATGQTDSRDAYLAAIRSGTVRYERLAERGVRVRHAGRAVLLVGEAEIIVATPGGTVRGRNRFLHVWAPDGHAWHLAAAQATRVADGS